jgi:uncharacterized protein
MHSVAVTGGSGLVGKALTKSLEDAGVNVIKLQRSEADQDPGGPQTSRAQVAGWNPDTGEIDLLDEQMPEAIVHLAGENIAGQRWTEPVKRRIRESRVQATRRMCEALAGRAQRPKVLVCASATGFYGDCGDQRLTEELQPGKGFLAQVCRDWEAATEPAEQAGIRIVKLRFGMILSKHGGALAKMLTPFKLGAGGTVGRGTQFWSWIMLADAVGVIEHSLQNEELRGPLNTVAPESMTNRDFTKTLGQVLRRPTMLPLPAFAARLMLGEMADELLLASTRVVPARLEAARYQFQYPTLAGGLRHELGCA